MRCSSTEPLSPSMLLSSHRFRSKACRSLQPMQSLQGVALTRPQLLLPAASRCRLRHQNREMLE